MTTIVSPPIQYPSGDGQPMAETFDPVDVTLVTIAVFPQYLSGEQACVQLQQELSNTRSELLNTQGELLATRSQAEALEDQIKQYRDRVGTR
jgi:hypothetical protein